MNAQQTAPEAEAPVEFAADLSPVMTALEVAYRMIQAEYPDAPDVTIVIKRDSKAWGHTTVAQVWGDAKAEQAHRYEVMISGENLRRGAADVAATLIHEAAHARNLARGIRDTDVNGRHNLKFKAAAEEMGLTVVEIGWHGWTGTNLSEDGLKRWRRLVARIDKGLARAVVASAHPVMPVLPPVGGKGGGIAVGGLGGLGGGIAIAPPKRGGRRTLIKAVCSCGHSIRVSGKVLDLARPKCQECDGLFVAVD
jgi:hypothetical protein